MIEYLPDTKCFFESFQGRFDGKRELCRKSWMRVIDSTIYIECIQGSKSNQEKRII